MDPLVHLIYCSTASAAFDESQLAALLGRSRANNARLGISGMLLYVEGSFFQVLEGAERDVAGLYARISADQRHHRVVQIIHESIARRDFGDWTMGFSATTRDEAATLLGENDFFGASSCLSELGPGRARKLLQAFRAGHWRSDETGLRRLQPQPA